MFKELKSALKMLAVLTLITGVLYPLAVTGIAGVLFPVQAHGSLVQRDELAARIPGAVASVVGDDLPDRGTPEPAPEKPPA